jgi:hypothetical protein
MLKIVYTACAVIAVVSTASIVVATTKTVSPKIVAPKIEQYTETEKKQRAFWWGLTSKVVGECIYPFVNFNDPKAHRYLTDATWLIKDLANDNYGTDNVTAAMYAVAAEKERLGAEFCRVWKSEIDHGIQVARERVPEQLERFYQNVRRDMRHDQ